MAKLPPHLIWASEESSVNIFQPSTGRPATAGAGQLLRLALLALVLLAVGQPAFANGHPSVNTTANGVAMHGYDPMSYHLLGEPREGSKQHTATYQGATYRFISEEHKQKFLEDPARYVPKYGGYCAYSVSLGKKFDVDPKTWEIIDGRLYLEHDQGTRVVWLMKVDKYIAIADRLWPKLKDVPAADLAAN